MVRSSLLAIPLAGILGGLSLLHAYWALGGRWASSNTVPVVNSRRAFEPGPGATWAVCGLLALAVMLVLGEAGFIPRGPFPMLFDAGVWGVGVVFLLRAIGNLSTFGFFKKVTGTGFARWDTRLYSPLCLMLAALAFGLASQSAP
jgi:hypothetical protein